MTAWLTGWTKRVKLTIDAGDIDATLTNFPTLLHISTSCGYNADDISFVFDELTSDANRKKIAVTTDDGLTECKVEIEFWDNANEQAWLWIKVPSVDLTTNTDLYLYYDNLHADNDTNVGDIGSTPAKAVWDANYKAVHHLDETVSTSKDSLGVTDLTWANHTDDCVGEISKGHIYDGADDHEEKTACPFGLTTAFTIEFWVKPSDLNDTNRYIMEIGKAYTGQTNQLAIIWEYVNNQVELYAVGATGDNLRTNSGMTLTAAWRHVVYTYDGATLVGYVDGAVVISLAKVTTLPTLDELYLIGASKNLNSGAYANCFKGSVDEVRWSNIGRIAAYVKATYETGRDHLLDWGTEETSTPFTDYPLDVVINQLSTKQYSLDTAFKSLNIVQIYPIDIVIKKLNAIIAYLIDVGIITTDTKEYFSDIVFKQPDAAKNYLIDVIMKEINILKTYSIDTMIINQYTIIYPLDVVMKKLNTLKRYKIDVAMKQLDELKTYSLDVKVANLIMVTYLLDVIIEQLGALKAYPIDVAIQELGELNTYLLDVKLGYSLTSDKNIGYSLDSTIKQLNALETYLVDSRFVSSAIKTYFSDTTLKKTNTSFNYGIDVMILHAIVLEYILEREKVGEVKITVPDWVSDNPDIDSNVWSKKKKRMTLTARIDDATMLRLLTLKGNFTQIYDGYNNYTAFIINTDGYWTTDPIYPWVASIDFIVILSDEP